MRAITATRFGAPDVLELVELPTPEPKAGEFRIDVEAAGVGWLDALIRSGHGPDVFEVEPPYVPGGAVAGTVTAVGAEVPDGWAGARVIARAGSGYGGGYADTAISAPDAAFRVPDGLDPRTALAVMDDGSTAVALLEWTPVRSGDRVLVAPGAGGLGNLLVQLALAAGAKVVAGVRGPEKAAIARDLGAEAVDYAEPGWPDRVRQLTGGLDVAFDGLGGAVGAAAVDLLVDGGRFSGYGMTSGAEAVIGEADRQRLTVLDMGQLPEFWADNARRVQLVLAEAAAGRLRPVIGRTYPLAEAAAAHEDIEARRFVGKSLLLP
ncbi:zinc-binding dehydrogenase [Amycolatopsis sp. CA-230715]|uniref:zinc-binding dehydrogenase n=1 Tax=Amycolatopsis sp. CA-230715 TaxID=2745196 RepID=UPI001C024EF4|nr:zinc-binding dehydrogenase [Amycolatopsis sp. CA-230715]QWF81234.1 2-haloacrylate reductase [Amycolatopsis sp. CA-230715]